MCTLSGAEGLPLFFLPELFSQRNPFCSAKHSSLKSTTYAMQICKSFALIFMQNAGVGGSTTVSTIHCVTARILSVPAQSVWKLPRCGLPTAACLPKAGQANYISSGANCEKASGAASSNRVNRLRNTNFTMSVGPFLCLAMRSSVSSLSSGVAPALKKCGR